MGRLFKRNDGSPMRFYFVDLPDNDIEKYMFLIENNGGIVELIARENVFKFTLPSHAYDYKIVFDVQFIDDCVKEDKILDISDYFIGDSRLNLGCEFSRMFCGIKSCLLNQIPSSTVPESQKGTSRGPFDFSQVPLRKEKTVHNEDSDTEDEMMKPQQIVEAPLSDSIVEDKYITQPSLNDKNKLPALPEDLEDSKDYITPEIIEWISQLNKNRSKDEYGYPKKISHNYADWESRNLIDFVHKTNTIEKIYSELYWLDVVKLKLIPKERSYKSLYAHFIYKILNKIEEFRLQPELEREFVRCREKHEEEKKRKLLSKCKK